MIVRLFTGLIGVSAFIFPPAALILGITGITTAVIGGATTFGTSITEIALLNKCTEKADSVLKKDQDTFKSMAPWFQHAQDLITLIEKIIGFEVAKEMYKKFTDCNEDIGNLIVLKKGLVKILDLGTDLGMTIASVALKTGVVVTKEVTQATARMVAQGALFGFGIVLDVANLAITSIDIHKGSKSAKANEINTIADRMETELKVLESIYKELGGNSF